MTSILPFYRVCQLHGIPTPAAEYRFAPPRRWRFDWAWPAQMCALEGQGGLFVHGRHSRGAALLNEHDKLNRAAGLGWRVLYCTPQTLESVEIMNAIRLALAHGWAYLP